MTGPFETWRAAHDALPLPGVAVPGRATGPVHVMNLDMLLGTINAAGCQLGSYDREVIEWLATQQPEICIAIAQRDRPVCRPCVT